MAHIYSVSVRWVETKMDVKSIDNALDPVGDWLRLDGYQWYCATDLDVKSLYATIEPLLTSKDSVVIAAIDRSMIWGHASNTVWNWFGKNGASISGKK